MVDVLLINPPWANREGHIYSKVGAFMPPLGLAQIAAILQEGGLSVEIIDAVFFNSREELEERVKSSNAKVVGISATTSTIVSAKDVCESVRNVLPNSKIVFGGVHPSVAPEEVASLLGVTCVVMGEAESVVFELAKALLNDLSFENIQGVAYVKNGKFFKNPWPTPVADLNSLPRPAYDLLPMDKYKPAYGTYKKLPAISMVTSRGCPGVCTFCYKGMFGTKIRAWSPKTTLDNIEYLVNRFGIKEIIFYDDTFTVLRENVFAICDGIKKRGLDISWSCMARVDYVDQKMLDAMASAGCHSVGFGVESADEGIIKTLCKQISLKTVRTAVRCAQKAGIEARTFFMLGNPGETIETMKKTIDFAVELEPDIALFNITTPFPGTAMYRWAEKNGYLTTKDWLRYDCSEPIMDLPTVSRSDILEKYKEAYKRFYLRPSYILRRLLKLRSFEDIKMGIGTVRGILNQ